jgi:hypothetical protein
VALHVTVVAAPRVAVVQVKTDMAPESQPEPEPEPEP